MRIALIGASGFIGLRMTEIFHLGGVFEVCPIVRSASSLAVLARMRLDWRISDLLDEGAMAEALRGCAICVHAAIGDAAQIVRMARVAYGACALAGVSRLVWLSSASVHGQSPSAETVEATPLHDRHPMVYNNAKVRAEWALDRLEKDGRVEVVKLRPSVVFGPRSQWVANAAESLLTKRAAWIDGGRGICNTVYVDNLVEAVRLAVSVQSVSGESFLVGDAETVHWREFLLPIAESLGFSEDAFTSLRPSQSVPEREDRLAALTMSPFYAQMGRMVPPRAKRIVKGLARGWPEPVPSGNAWTMRSAAPEGLSSEMSLLQQCTWKLPQEKAKRVLGYHPPVSFKEGMGRSLSWLEFAGYPIATQGGTS